MADLLMTTGDVARAIGISTERVRQLDNTRKLPARGRTLSGMRLFRADDVTRYVAARQGRGTR